MASVYKKKCYIDPATGKVCAKSIPGAVQKVSQKYYIGIVVNGQPRRFVGFTDRKATEAKAAELELHFARGEVGLLNPFAEHLKKSTAKHVDEFIADLTSTGKDAENMNIMNLRLAKLLKECTWTRLTDITPDSFKQWRQAQQTKESPLSGKTLNQYLQIARQFCRWCVDMKRIASDPLALVKPVKVVEAKRKRRAMTQDEAIRLLSVCGGRKVIYLMALYTGLRRAELEQLQWRDVHLDEQTPHLRVRASTTKNGKEAVIVLGEEVAAGLQALEKPSDPLQFIFGREHRNRKRGWMSGIPSTKTFYEDLAAAKIPQKDAEGRLMDLHSLRHTLATNLAKAGVAPRVAMEVMRHSDMKLTQKVYTDATQLPTVEAITCLPAFGPKGRPNAVSQMVTSGHLMAQARAEASDLQLTVNQGFSLQLPAGKCTS